MTRPLYCSVATIRKYLPTDLPVDVDTDMIEGLIEENSGYIDDYVASQYVTPFPGVDDTPSTPPTIMKICRYLTVYELYISMSMSSEKDDPRQSLYTRAHKLLDQVRDLSITLGSGEDLERAERETPPMMSGRGRGPASLDAQDEALGRVHNSTRGGLGYPSNLPDGEVP